MTENMVHTGRPVLEKELRVLHPDQQAAESDYDILPPTTPHLYSVTLHGTLGVILTKTTTVSKSLLVSFHPCSVRKLNKLLRSSG